jgi:pheromone shutdown protein TraB
MIILVGVGHVFDIQKQVRQIIHEHVPSAVALELDRNRFYGLQARARGEVLPGSNSFAARFQDRIASQFGVKAGDEMLAGAKAASEINAKLMLIDRDINWVMDELRRRMTFKEKVKMLVALFFTPFVRKKTVEREMKKYEEASDQYLEELAEEFPTIKAVLIDERNTHMANALLQIENQHGSVLAIIGDGHVGGISKLLAEKNPKVIRLAEVRGWKVEAKEGQASVSFSVNVQ